MNVNYVYMHVMHGPCLSILYTGGQWRTFDIEEQENKSAQPCWRCQLGLWLCFGEFDDDGDVGGDDDGDDDAGDGDDDDGGACRMECTECMLRFQN